MPIESVTEYFEHFPLLEIDYTFYRLLLEKDGKPTQNFHVLKNYRQHMKDGDFVLLKAPQIVIARKLRRGSAFVENENYLNADIFTKQFYKPAVEILGPCLNGIIFEQEYHPKNDRFPASQLPQYVPEYHAHRFSLPDWGKAIETARDSFLVHAVHPPHALTNGGSGNCRRAVLARPLTVQFPGALYHINA